MGPPAARERLQLGMGHMVVASLEGIDSRAPGEFDVVTDLDSPSDPAMLDRLFVQED